MPMSNANWKLLLCHGILQSMRAALPMSRFLVNMGKSTRFCSDKNIEHNVLMELSLLCPVGPHADVALSLWSAAITKCTQKKLDS